MSHEASNTPNPDPVRATSSELASPADLQLTPPAPVAVVATQDAAGRVKLSADAKADLDEQVTAFIATVTRYPSATTARGAA